MSILWAQRMKILRNKSLSTQILILYELYTGHYSKLAPLATKLNVTQQAISDYIMKMKTQDLVQKIDREYKPTIKGVSLLQQEILLLKDFTDDCIQHLSLITSCIAIATAPIKKGTTVYLYMDNGWLYATTDKKTSSTGISLSSVDEGSTLPVGNLKGILDHHTGKIIFVSFHDPFLPAQKQFEQKRVEQQLKKPTVDVIAILDAMAKVISRNIGVRPDIEYGGIHAIIDAAQRGLNVAVLGYKQNTQNAITFLDKHNEQSSQPLEYDVLSLY
jgi:predicted transcriptional regulator